MTKKNLYLQNIELCQKLAPIMDEQWKWIYGYKGLYEISSMGRIRSYHRQGRIMNSKPNRFGYNIVSLHNKGKVKVLRVHRLVASAFLAKKRNKPYVNHINGIKTDNRVENLEWCTIDENNYHAEVVTGVKLTKPVHQLDLRTGKIIKKFRRAKDAAREIGALCSSGITRVCKGLGKHCKGYGWQFVNESDAEFKLTKITKLCTNCSKKITRPPYKFRSKNHFCSFKCSARYRYAE